MLWMFECIDILNYIQNDTQCEFLTKLQCSANVIITNFVKCKMNMVHDNSMTTWRFWILYNYPFELSKRLWYDWHANNVNCVLVWDCTSMPQFALRCPCLHFDVPICTMVPLFALWCFYLNYGALFELWCPCLHFGTFVQHYTAFWCGVDTWVSELIYYCSSS